MDDAYPRKREAWPTLAGTALQEAPAVDRLRPGPLAAADRLYASESFAAPHRPEAAEPYSLQWFLDIENQRHGRHGRWVPRLLEFAKHSGETLLGLGGGLGTDWVQYARHGAHVVVCSPSTDQLALVRRNFELRGLGGRFLTAHPAGLPLDSASIDVACLTDLLGEVEEPQRVVEEVYRVLKPGGKVVAVAPARYDVDYWSSLLLPWRAWGRTGPPGRDTRFSARGLRRLFDRFVEHRLHKRQLRRSDVPHLWRVFPLPLLERLIGRVLVLKAFKPLSAAIAAPPLAA